MIFGSVCSGIEAASVAWEPLGWKARFFAEIEPFPSAVLAHRFPGVPNLGDFTKIGEEHGPVDVLVGGTPCQSFSVAGKRAGLDDPRGNLALEYLALARRLRPRWLVFENVPGLLSSWTGPEPPSRLAPGQRWESTETSDFGCFLAALAELGYGFAYRVLDAQFCGVPQRRRRVFVVGCPGDWRRAAAVLLEHHSLSGDPPPSREAGARASALTADGVGTCGADDNQAQAGHIVPSLMGSGAGMERTAGLPAEADYLVANAVTPGAGNRNDPSSDSLIAHSLRAEGFDAGEDGTGRGTPLVPVAFDPTQVTSRENRSNPNPGGPAPTLAKGAHPPAVAFSSKDHGADAGEVAPTLRAGQHVDGNPNAGCPPAIAFSVRGREGGSQAEVEKGDVAPAMRVSAGGGGQHTFIASSAVRRLTPRECERLQGFPDDWTLVPVKGKPAADGPRYRAIGNSMAVPVMRWIGARIAMVEELTG